MATIINSFHEKNLVEKGLETFSLEEKNNLIMLLAGQAGIALSEITDEYILDYHKQLKISLMSDACEEAILAGFTASNGHYYRTNRDDQINLIGQKDELLETGAQQVPWKTEDAGYVMHSKEEWLSVYTEAFMHKKKELMKYNTLKHAILAAETHADVIAIGWEEKPEVIEEEPQEQPPIETPQPEPEDPKYDFEITPPWDTEEEPTMMMAAQSEPIDLEKTEEPAEKPKSTMFQIFNRKKSK